MTETIKVAVIGGTGVGQFPFDDEPQTHSVTTTYGVATITVGTLRGERVAFLARHGAGHRLPPHRINHRANIAALARLGVRAVIATAAVGALHTRLFAGDFVLPDDFIDFTGMREGKTFFDGDSGIVVHTDFTRPYSDAARAAVLAAAESLATPIHPAGTYLACDGPRYETPAEVRLFAQWGADVVGMTGVPEATLAREAGLHYAGIALVTNPGAGLSATPLTHAEVEAAMRDAAPRLRALLAASVARLGAMDLPPLGPGMAIPGLNRV